MDLSRKNRVTWFAAWTGFGLVALFLAAVSAGAGHGDYLLAKFLFPVPMLIGMSSETLAGLPLILALIEYPGIGLLGFKVRRRSGFAWIALAYVVVSSVWVLLVFLRPIEQLG